MKPTLKKVSKYENKFAKLQKKAAEFNFRNQLKQVKKKEFTLEEEDKEVRTTVFDRIFASKRREYFFRKIVFSLPVKGLFQMFLNLSKQIFAEIQAEKFYVSFYTCVFPNMYFNFHLEFIYYMFVHLVFLRIFNFN